MSVDSQLSTAGPSGQTDMYGTLYNSTTQLIYTRGLCRLNVYNRSLQKTESKSQYNLPIIYNLLFYDNYVVTLLLFVKMMYIRESEVINLLTYKIWTCKL